MASKESMVTAPLAVLLLRPRLSLRSLRGAVRARGRLYGGLAATWLVLAGLLWSAPRSLSAGFSAHDADAWTYLLNQTVMITRYLWLAVWPRDLVLYYGWPLPLTLGAVLPQAALIVALLALTAFALWRWPRLGFLGAWLFLTLAPTSSIVPIATEVGAERRMYLALIALVALARRWRSGRLVASLQHPGGCRLRSSTVAARHSAPCRESRNTSRACRLAETTLDRWPTPGAHSMLGTELAAAGRLSEAERHLREAAPVHPPARYYLGTVLDAQGRRAEAIRALHSRSSPASRRELDQVHIARALLAEALTKEGRLDEAAAQYRAMLATDPDDGQAMRCWRDPPAAAAVRRGD